MRLQLIYTAVTENISKFPEREKEIKEIYQPRITLFTQLINEKVNNFTLTLSGVKS